jgi:FlaA1/EpsC-like NDP-sugar epimerase
MRGGDRTLRARLRKHVARVGWDILVHHPVRARVVADSAAWVVALSTVSLLRFDLNPTVIEVGSLLLFAAMVIAVHAIVGCVHGLYLGRWRFGSFEEVAALVVTLSVTTGIGVLLDVVLPVDRLVPVSVAIGAGGAALILMAGLRYLWRLGLEHRQRPRGGSYRRLIIFGAGEGGAQVLRSLLRTKDGAYLPVALLDDDPSKRRLKIMGVPVVGTRHDLLEVARSTAADAVLIAIPSAGADLVREMAARATDAGLEVKVVPAVSELFGEPVGATDIRSVTEEDLLGRREIETDLGSIAGYLAGKRVLVTGAGGSIGSELCRQITRFAPASLIMVDRDESALHAVQLSIEGRALLDSKDLVLLDIRDRAGVRRIFEERRPQVVFHAAALKHLPLLERFPAEALKSNVWGTLAVLDAAAAVDVERFVNISTDKAAAPSSVLGYTKRVTERLTASIALNASGTYLSVRFGNVLGSRGSVLVAFRAQIEVGGPITVTDPDVTRYFMTVSEAVELVIQAGAIGNDGEVLVLDMGEPVRIADVARRLVAAAERPIEIVYTGLRPGEKLHEILTSVDEVDYRPIHPLISHAQVPPTDPCAIRDLDPRLPPDELVKVLHDLAEASAPSLPQSVGRLLPGETSGSAV